MAIDNFSFQKQFAIRRAHRGQSRTVEVTMPFDEIERQARARGMTVDQFIEHFETLCEWGDGKSVRYTFTEKEDENKQL